MDSTIKVKLGFKEIDSDDLILNAFREKKRTSCKPCWELKYCPYGILVEEFPLLPESRIKAINNNNYMKNCLVTGKLENGKPLDKRIEESFRKQILSFNSNNYPEIHPEIVELECNVFGHMCPVYFVAELFTETEQERRRGRYISFEMKMRIVRRDNYTCQICGKHLKDNEVEFDHIIPLSKGGSSEEHNIRLTCFSCNREKSDKTEI